MKTWVKLYTEISRDPKMLTLSWAQRGIWSTLLALAGELYARDENGQETGELDTVEYTAIRIRCDPAEFQEAIAAFTERGMIEERDGVLILPHYAKRQEVPLSQTRPAMRDRQRMHRASHVVTLPSHVVTLSDPDPDPESDPERDPDPEPVGAHAPENGGGGVSSDPEMGAVWTKTLAMLQQERGNGYNHWLGDAELMELTENKAVIRVRDEEVRDLCRDRLQSLVSRSLLAALGFPVNVRMDLEFCTAAVF